MTMTRNRTLSLLVLAVAVAAVASSVTWAATRSSAPAWQPGHSVGSDMMGVMPGGSPAPVTSADAAKQAAQVLAGQLDLKVDEVLRFELNYYVKLVDAKGADATEVLVDPKTGYVMIEYGPAMMWNTKYGMAGGRLAAGMMSGAGMMGRYGAGYGMMNGSTQRGAGMTGGSAQHGSGMGAGMSGGMNGQQPTTGSGKVVAIAEARTLAQAWLDANDKGVLIEQAGDSFPGYFTFETLRDGKIQGMISVNTSTGIVWSHWWHGKFAAKSA